MKKGRVEQKQTNTGIMVATKKAVNIYRLKACQQLCWSYQKTVGLLSKSFSGNASLLKMGGGVSVNEQRSKLVHNSLQNEA